MALWGVGRHYTKYYYTVKTISEATGKTPGTVRNDVWSGVLDMRDIQSVSAYVQMFGTKRQAKQLVCQVERLVKNSQNTDDE